MSNRAERVRYGRVDVTTRGERVPKNTLLTIRDGDLVYFGIVRCNSRLDRFSKNTGKLIAKNRARLAANETKEVVKVAKDKLATHFSGLRGTVGVDNIRDLLQYFKDIDTEILSRHLSAEALGAEFV